MSVATVPALEPAAVRQPVRWPQALAASVVGPVLLSLAFPKFDVGIAAFIALVPLFWLWAKSSWKHALGWGFVAGIVMFALLLNWTTHSLRDFIGEWWVLGLVLVCIWQGLNIACMALVTSLLCRGEFRTAAVFAAPAIWLLAETWRTRGSLGVPFGELGLAAIHLPWLLPLAAYGGVYLLTFLISLANAAIVGIIAGTPNARRTGVAVLCALAVLIAAGDLAQQRVSEPPATLRVGIAQGNVSQAEKWSPLIFAQSIQTYAHLTREAAGLGARLVVWPETAVTSAPLQDPALLATLGGIAQNSKVWLVTGAIDKPSTTVYYNALIDLNPAGQVAGVYHKHRLVPFAEYLPAASVLGSLPLMDQVSRFSPGPGPKLLPAAGWWWGPLICYESAFAPYARATANAGADAIIVATDDAWFGGTAGPIQHADIGIIDAVSTGRWVVRGADTGISMIVDPRGTIVARLPMGVQGTIVADVGHGIQTGYDRFGIAWLLALSVLAIIAAAWRPKAPSTGWRSRRGAP